MDTREAGCIFCRPHEELNGLIDLQHVLKYRAEARSSPYATNDLLTIMVPQGSRRKIKSLSDLGKPGIRPAAMPNRIRGASPGRSKIALAKAGGDALEKMVYDTKVGMARLPDPDTSSADPVIHHAGARRCRC